MGQHELTEDTLCDRTFWRFLKLGLFSTGPIEIINSTIFGKRNCPLANVDTTNAKSENIIIMHDIPIAEHNIDTGIIWNYLCLEPFSRKAGMPLGVNLPKSTTRHTQLSV